MGRRLNLSTPTVINTELIPLDESFYIEANGNTEQWYYDNTNVYAPNRNVIPLTLTPRLSVFDGDTKTTYTPTFFMVKWYAKEYNEAQGGYVETQITTTDPAATDYVLSCNNLLVKKNVPYSHDVTIRCEATYVDPRDTGVTSTIQDTVTLLTNRDASTISPMIEIDCPASQGFNPLTATTSKYTLKGRASWGQDLANDNIVTFKADPLGTENIIPTNEDSIDSAAPTLSLRYGSINQADQTFMSRQTSGGHVGNIEGNVGYVTNIKGDTVKMVQMVKKEVVIGITAGTWATFDAGTSISASNDILTITKSSGYGIAQYRLNAKSIASGHKYYMYAQIKTQAPANSVIVYAYGVDALIDVTHQYNIASNDWQEIYSIGSCTTDYPDLQLFRVRNAEKSDFHDVQVRNCMFIDLTLMFGSGNEPTTVAAFESWLSTHIGTKSYYPYTEGRLINYGGYQVKMNQLVENGDFKNTDGWSSDAGTISVDNKTLTFVPNTRSAVSGIKQQYIESFKPNHKFFISVDTKFSNTDFTATCTICIGGSGLYGITGWIQEPITPSTQWSTKSLLASTGNVAELGDYIGMRFYDASSQTIPSYMQVKNFNVIDLTLMFGAGNEPDLDWCNAHFTEDYYPYHTGYDTNVIGLTNAQMGIKTVGFNLLKMQGRINETVSSLTPTSQHKFSENGYWNGIAVDGYTVSGTITNLNIGEGSVSGTNVRTSYGVGFPIRCEESTRYYIKASCKIGYFDADGVSISYTSDLENTTITTPANCKWMVVVFGTQSGSFSLSNLSVSLSSSKNGTYEPYWESFTDMSWVSKIGIENFNIWDEEWELGTFDNNGEPITSTTVIRSKNFMPIQGNTAYYNNGAGALYFYDSSKTFISSNNTSNAVVTSPVNAAYFKLIKTATGYANDICINKSIAHFNGRYYPYGVTAPYFPNGLCNVGSVYDEIKVVDGKIKGVVRLGCVDLGNFSYTLNYSDTYHVFMQNNAIPNAKTAISGGINAASSRFENKGWAYIASYSSNNADDVLCLNDTSMGVNALVIRDTTYTDAATFKAAVAGVPLIYELQTPYEFEIDYPTKPLFEWYGISNNTEVKADTLPWYVDGQNTDTLTVDAMYGEEIRVVLRAKKNYGDDLYPSKAYRSILWRIPDIDSSVLSENGSAVRSDTESMNFGTIVNIKGDTLSDDVKKEHLRFNWKSRRDNSTAETDQGWGLTKELPASELINVKSSPSSRLASTIVYPEVYLLGAYEKVTDEGNDVTEDGGLVYDRPVF